MKRNYSETRLHIAVANWLFEACPFLLWTHPANQGRSPQEGAKLKKMGVRAGTPDLLFWHNGWFGAIELKTESRMSESQKEFKRLFEIAGGRFSVCSSVSEVRDILISWGVNPEGYAFKEPKPPLSAQHRAAMEFFKP